MPTDFQLHRKMKLKLYFRLSLFFAVKKQNCTSIFHFSSSGRKRNSNSLNALRFSFSVAQKKKILSLFFVFRFSFSYGILKTDYDSFLVVVFGLSH